MNGIRRQPAVVSGASGTCEHAEDHAHDSEEADLGPAVDLTGETAVQVDIKDYAYTRPNIKIAEGTRVTWTNQDTLPHNVMQEPDVFAGPLLAKGERYSFTFTKVGSYPYHCSPHPLYAGGRDRQGIA